VRQRGILRRVVFARVNPDQDRELADQLIGGGPIPQLVMYQKTRQGWSRRSLIGGQSVEAVEQFIKEGIAEDTPPAKEAEKTQPAPAKKAAADAASKRPTA
jgi:hypothetical protein